MGAKSTLKDEDILGLIRRSPGITQPEACLIALDHGITPNAVKSRIDKLGEKGKIRIERRGRGVASLLWLEGQQHDSYNGNKETTRDRKFNAVMESGLDVRNFVTLSGETILSAHSYEERLLTAFPQASGYGAENDPEIYKKLFFSNKLPKGFQVASGDVRSLIQNFPHPLCVVDLDFFGSLTSERRETVRITFEKMRNKGILSLTVTNSYREKGGYAQLYPHSPNRQVCLLTELVNAAGEVGRYIDLIDSKPYVGKEEGQTMQLFIFKVRKEESLNAYEE